MTLEAIAPRRAAAPEPAAAPLLEVRALTCAYGRIEVLHGIELQVETGQLVALVGANGAGKTTLLRALSGVLPVSGGAILLDGQDIGRWPSHRRVAGGVCQVPEGRHVFGPMTVLDNLRLGGHRHPRAEVDADIERMYHLFPVLGGKRAAAAGTLSGGQQQMLAMARALMGRPRLLLLDEPSMGLAPRLVGEIFQVIQRLRGQGITILLVEQNARAALAIADVGYVIETGAITLGGAGRDLLANDEVRRAYLGL